MLKPQPTFDEEGRLRELVSLELLDTGAEEEFDTVVQLASEITGCPITLISLIDRDRQWFKAKVGLDAQETPRDISFCGHAIHDDQTFIVSNALDDPRFADNPLVAGEPRIRFYAGQPLVTSNGFRIGTLCTIDRVPRELSAPARRQLELLARQAVRIVELRIANRQLLKTQAQLEESARLILAARDEADKANETKSAFLANMSHEIRTPLGAIMGFAELLMSQDMGHDRVRDMLGRILKNGRALGRILDDVLDLAKVESGKLDLEEIPFSIRELIEEVLSLFEESAFKKNIYLRVSISAKIPVQILSDPSRIRQILINLVGNAIKFTEIGGVSIKVLDPQYEDEKIKMRIIVKDTGIGIEPEKQAKLFTPFSQVDNSISRKFGGTGLGLALAKRLALALGGDIKLFDCGLNQGCTFVLNFAASDRSDHAVLKAEEPILYGNEDTRKFAGIKILLAEDSEDLRELTTELLSLDGAIVDSVTDGHAVVKQAFAKDYDLILMDIQMPGMDGYEATRTLRKMNYQKPIVALTAHAMNEERAKSMSAGCNDHLVKPLDRRAIEQSFLRLLRP